MPTRWMDGNAALRDLLARSGYGSAEQAVASLTLFTHPATVMAAGHGPVFRVVRRKHQADVGRILPAADGRPVLHDDNTAPTHLFLWANGLPRGGYRDAQFNHVYARAPGDEASGGGQLAIYTSLPNLCVTPAFLAKLTDTDDAVRAVLRYRVFDVFGYAPAGRPAKPPGYDVLVWAPYPTPMPDLEATLRAALRRNAKSRTARSAREAGWRFSNYEPDAAV